VTQWVQAKLDKIVTSLSQLLINYYRYGVKIRQLKQVGRKID